MRDDRDDIRQQYADMLKDYPPPEVPKKGVVNRFDPYLPFFSLASAGSTFFGLHSTVPGNEPMRNLVVCFIPCAIGGLSYILNKVAFHHGSVLAASGRRSAIWITMAWFLGLGASVSSIGLSGLGQDIFEAARAREASQHILDAKRRVEEAAANAKRVVPLITSGKADVDSISDCDATIGCVSGQSGLGNTVATLKSLASRFKSVETAYAQAEKARSKNASKFDQLAFKYEAVLNEGGGLGANRAKLLAMYNEAQSLVTELANAFPTQAATALVSELRSIETPQALPGRIDVGARLRGHADRLEEALEKVSSISVALPPYPAPAGLIGGWQRLDLIAPLAVVLVALEGVLIALWWLLVIDFKARRTSARNGNEPPDDTPTADGGALVAHHDAYAPRRRRT